MGTLTVGRVAIPDSPASMSRGDGALSLGGTFTGASLAQTKMLRDELAATLSNPDPVPVTWDGDATIDGFYLVAGGSVDLRHDAGTGLVDYELDLEHCGDDNSLRLCSLITGAVLANDHSFTAGVGYVAPPIGHYGFSPVSDGTPAYVTRKSEDGNLLVYLGVDSGDNPQWHAAPGDYYKAACEILTGTYLRAGLLAPNTPTDWQLQNALVKVVPTTDGALIVSHYDGTAWRATTWAVLYASAAVGNWDAVTILTNRPERVAIRLTQTRGAQQGRLTLDLALRRGSRTLEGVFYSDIATSAMMLDTDTAGTTTGTPTGSMKKSTVDAFGHRWMVGSEKTTTLTTADGTMAKTANRLPFMISKEVDEGTGVQTGDTDDELWAQYMGWRSERVRSVIP
jgi:hypothetical protein